ncbi:MAG: TfoX family protein [Sphingomonadales bacterium]|nr:MAG: TfoX family protein [Sphingomonadales bacterium]
MAYDAGLIDWAKEALEPLGAITHRPMMGAAMLYCDGLVVAVVDEETIYFKNDKVTDDVYDDEEAMRRWAALALEASQRAPIKRKRK